MLGGLGILFPAIGTFYVKQEFAFFVATVAILGIPCTWVAYTGKCSKCCKGPVRPVTVTDQPYARLP